jgi:hypothetical protein
MKDIGFKKEITTGCYLDPFNGFQERKIPIELRYDEITGVACRIYLIASVQPKGLI